MESTAVEEQVEVNQKFDLDQEVVNVALFAKKKMQEDGKSEITVHYDELKSLIQHDEDNFTTSINRIKHVLARKLEKNHSIQAVRKGQKYTFKHVVADEKKEATIQPFDSEFQSFEIPYVLHRKFRFISKALRRGNFPLLVGPKGCGKSRTAEEAAKSMGLKCIRIALGEVREPADLIGTKEIVSENGCPKTKFIPGLLTEAAIHGWCAILDEFDSVQPSVALALNKVLEGGRVITLPMESGVEEIEVNKNFRVICTSNTWGCGDDTGHYAGTSIQNRATLDRLGPKIDFDYDINIERQILKPYLPAPILDAFFNTEGIESQHGIILKIRRSDEIDDTIGMRSLIRFAQDYKDFGWHIASHFMLNDILPEFRPVVKAIIVGQLGNEFVPSDNDNDPNQADYITDQMRNVVKEKGF